MAEDVVVEIRLEADIVQARQAARQLAIALGFSLMDQSRIATAVSELARNVVRYATDGQGDVRIQVIRSPESGLGLEIVVSDSGPGIPDIALAMEQGFTSGKGLGLGLSGTKRLMDEMIVDSAPKGTTVTIRKWKR